MEITLKQIERNGMMMGKMVSVEKLVIDLKKGTKRLETKIKKAETERNYEKLRLLQSKLSYLNRKGIFLSFRIYLDKMLGRGEEAAVHWFRETI